MRYLLLMLATAAVILAAVSTAVLRYPARQAGRAMEGLAEIAGGVNRFHHERLPDETWRTIVRPSPDLLYSAMVFDLRAGPLRLTFPHHADYWSAQFIDPRTSTFANVGNSAGVTGPTRVFLTLKDKTAGEGRVIHSPEAQGVLILRYLVRKPDDISALDRLRRMTLVERAVP